MFPGLSDRETAPWLRMKILSEDKVGSGNKSFFFEVCKHYCGLWVRSGRKIITERYKICQMADMFEIFRMYLRTGKELGSERPLFHNEGRVVVTVAVKEHMSMGESNGLWHQ